MGRGRGGGGLLTAQRGRGCRGSKYWSSASMGGCSCLALCSIRIALCLCDRFRTLKTVVAKPYVYYLRVQVDQRRGRAYPHPLLQLRTACHHTNNC
jgi:hypothetical protein